MAPRPPRPPRPPPSPQLVPLLPRTGPTSPSGVTSGLRRGGDSDGMPVVVAADSTAIASTATSPTATLLTSSSSSSSVSSTAGHVGPMLLLAARGGSDDALESVTVVDGGTDGDSSYSVCSMKTVTVSSLLTPSPCFVALILLAPPAIGLVLFAFVQHFVPVLVDLLMAM